VDYGNDTMASDDDGDWQGHSGGSGYTGVRHTEHCPNHDIPKTMLPADIFVERAKKGEGEASQEEQGVEGKRNGVEVGEGEAGMKIEPAKCPVLLPEVPYPLVLQALDQIRIPVNDSRLNVKINTEQLLHGMCLGCVNARSYGVCASAHSYKLRYLTQLLVEFGRRALPADYKFTSIQVNKNYMSAMHVDKGNVGPSYIVGVGDFDGGKLWVHRQQYRLQQDVAQGYTPQELASLYPTTDG
jgi:hypothetical protein